MAWLWTRTSPGGGASTPALSSDGTPIAPDRQQRARCWEGRDAFFACLSAHAIVDATTPEGAARAQTACAPDLARFEAACARSWVEYFQKRRVMEWRKEQTLQKLEAEGAQRIPGEVRGVTGPVGGTSA